MNKFTRIFLLALVSGIAAFAQTNTLTQTSLSSAISATGQLFNVASATNITTSPATLLYVDKEAMLVLAVNGTTLTVARGQITTKAVGHPSAAMVLVGRPDWFTTTDQTGSCVAATTYATPTINITNGNHWLCSTLTLSWVPGFWNWSAELAPTTAVASAAGAVTPSGPLFHMTGALAITSFNIPVGFSYGSFTIIPDAAFTLVSGNNLGASSTAIVGKPMVMTYDPVTAKFYPSY